MRAAKTMMTRFQFQQELMENLGNQYHIQINDNRSTMLSVKWGELTRVSMHRMFLDAPRNIMQDLACYIKRESHVISPKVKAYIEDNLKKLDYRHQVDIRKLEKQGNVYHLQEIYNKLNREYFNDRLNLLITWFGKVAPKNRSRITFGLYYDPLRLIKIHRLLDAPSIPEYFIEYVIFHEMSHHVCPAYVDKKGINRVHSKEFKALEKKYRHYDLAQQWIKDYQGKLFF